MTAWSISSGAPVGLLRARIISMWRARPERTTSNGKAWTCKALSLGPAIGDLDGDGQPELVICSLASNSGYNSGRILVFDLATLALRAMSDPAVEDLAFNGVHDLKLRDVQGNLRKQIIIGAARIFEGAIEIYRFDSNNTFTRIWTNATLPD